MQPATDGSQRRHLTLFFSDLSDSTRIAATIGEPALSNDPRFKTAVARAENEDAIDDLITRWTLRHTCAECEQTLHAAEVPAARIYTVADIFKDPHYAARGMLAKVPDDDLGTVTMTNVVPRLSATPGAIRHSGRRVGQDTRQVLRELAGLSVEEISRLEDERIVVCDQPDGTIRNVEASEST